MIGKLCLISLSISVLSLQFFLSRLYHKKAKSNWVDLTVVVVVVLFLAQIYDERAYYRGISLRHDSALQLLIQIFFSLIKYD